MEAQLIVPEDREPRQTRTAERALAAGRTAPPTPVEMLDAAVRSGANIETLERLIALQERWEAGNSRKAFDAAISDAKGKIGPILKNREVDFTSQKGRTNYRHEDFAQVARTVDPVLREHGLSYRFRSAQEGQRVRVTCILSHRDGYSEETTLEAAEDHSGNKNTIQAIGSAATYLQRYTLKLALGLSSSQDDDGHAAGAGERITPEQVAKLEEMVAAVGADRDRFLRFLRVDSLADIPISKFAHALSALDKKKGAANE